MSRRRKAVKRPTMPDPRHGSPLVSTLVNAVMQSGKKSTCTTNCLRSYREDGRET